MEAFLLFVETWWWAAPVAAGAGAAGYRAVTTNRRRARRLELDAARHEERLALRTLWGARAEARAAKADMLAAKARRAPLAALAEARRRFAATKDQEWSASLNLRASRSRLRAAQVQYHTSGSDDPLPLAVLGARQDAVTARWLAYETDPAKALSYPQMLDAQHPSTLAFLRAQRDAQELRPSPGDRVSPATYLAYRDAVGAAEAAFEAAERDALGIAGESAPGLTWGSITVPLPTWLPRAAELLSPWIGPADAAASASPPDPQTSSRRTWPPPAWHPAPPPQH